MTNTVAYLSLALVTEEKRLLTYPTDCKEKFKRIDPIKHICAGGESGKTRSCMFAYVKRPFFLIQL